MSKALDIPAEAQGVLDFWFGEATPEQWFEKDEKFDATIRERFAALFARAVSGELAGWRESARGCLALVIVLDQFPRNLFRGGARSFATDAPARAVLHHALEKGFDDGLPVLQRQFLYLPLQHSEDADDQALSVELNAATGDADLLKRAEAHKRIIDRFGRFPHRNESLGRKNTPEESEFLKQKGSSF